MFVPILGEKYYSNITDFAILENNNSSSKIMEINFSNDKYAHASLPKQEFYYYLGLMSTKFAKIEYNILTILGLLIIEDFVLSGTLLERNTLERNIELLKKVNQYRMFKTSLVSQMLAKLGSVKKNRNLFIHGIWSEPYIEENDLMISCSERKIQHTMLSHGNNWSSAKNHKFRIGYIKKQVLIIDEIILTQDHLIKELENNPGQFN